LLWHFDESAATAGLANDFTDSSGKGMHGEQNSGVTFGTSGILNLAASLDGTNDRINHTFQLPKAAGTLSHWLYPTSISTANSRVAYYESNQNQNGWTSNTQGAGTLEINSGIISGNWAFAYQDDNFTSDGGSDFYTAIAAVPGKWTHMAVTWDRAGDLKIYIDGDEVYSIDISGTAYGSIAADPTYTSFGRTGAGTAGRSWLGKVDELAVWSRVLDPKEIHQLYRRGANRILYQGRACTTATCADDPTGANWKGPDNTRYTYFSELHNTTSYTLGTNLIAGQVQKALPALSFANFNSAYGAAQYFQYRAILETDDSGSTCDYGAGATWCSPELKSVTVGPTHFDPASPTIIGKVGVGFTSLSNFVETLGASCASGIGYNLGVGTSHATASWYYWNGAAWVAANGLPAQSSPEADLSANAASFATVAGSGTVYFKAFLKSTGATGCELNQLQLDGVL
jgi:hypothetical protein